MSFRGKKLISRQVVKFDFDDLLSDMETYSDIPSAMAALQEKITKEYEESAVPPRVLALTEQGHENVHVAITFENDMGYEYSYTSIAFNILSLETDKEYDKAASAAKSSAEKRNKKRMEKEAKERAEYQRLKKLYEDS